MKAMILAAGVGSRLDPITRNVPKPMVPILNQPVIEHIVQLLVKHGFNEIVCNTHYLADKIEDHFSQREGLGATMRFNREEELLGTAGGLKRVAENFGFFDKDETFLVIGGDDLTEIDLTAMLEFHRANNSLATIGLTRVEDPSQFGVVVTGKGGKIERFVEKPKPGTAPSNLVNTGVYLFEPRVLEKIPSGVFYDFGKNVFPELLEAGEPFYGYEMDAYWRDVGNLREYRESHDDFFEGLGGGTTTMKQTGEGLWIGEGCEIDPSAQLIAPVMIGSGCKIGPNARVGEKSVIGEGCVVGADAHISHSVLWSRAKVGAGTHLYRSIVGYDVEVATNAGIFDATIVSPHAAGTSKTLEK